MSGAAAPARRRHVHWHEGRVGRAQREAANGHPAATLWLTGLSGSGKSTLARAVEEALFQRGCQVYVLDGDNVRHGLNRDLGFGPADRRENIRRIAEVAKLLADAGAFVIAAFISPYREDRDAARTRLGPGDFIEVFVDCDLATCEERDPKGLYAKARRGEIPEFTGISAPYEPPADPELVVDTARRTLPDCVAHVIDHLERNGYLPRAVDHPATRPPVEGSSLNGKDPAGPRAGDWTGPIAPYGGRLVDRRLSGAAAAEARRLARGLPRIRLSAPALSDLYLLATGALSPLEGFMGRADYQAVLDRLTLANGLPWTLPVTLPVTADDAEPLAVGREAALIAPDGELAGILHVTELFPWDRDAEAERVYGTTDRAHPGVARLDRVGPLLAAGPVDYVYDKDVSGFPAQNLTPAGTRAEFERRGWRSVVAFQTRNPVHRAHEYLQKVALEMVDGLLLHPLVGDTKADDVPADVRMRCYQTLLEHYYPADRVLLSVLPAAMRYAGPREAVHHAIIRRNYGCTHFIVGRDHAGVGSYYGSYDAQEIFDTIDADALGIVPLRFEHAFYCERCAQMASRKSCPHGAEHHVFLSGTKVRAMLAAGERPPAEFTRPEVADVLMDAMREVQVV